MNRFTVTEKAMRPASSERKCFYCTAPIGTHHWPDCILVKKKVKVRATIEYEINVPLHWTLEDIERYRNKGSWCCDNIAVELNEIITERKNKGESCLCDSVHFEVIQDNGESFLIEK